jgi:hypothetical protein
MVDGEFIDVIAPVTDPLFFEDLLNEVDHVPGIVRPVIAAIDEKDIEFFPVIPEFLFIGYFFKFPVSTGALRAFFRRTPVTVDESAHMTFPNLTWWQAGHFRFPWRSSRHAKIPPPQAPGIPGRDNPALLLYGAPSGFSQAIRDLFVTVNKTRALPAETTFDPFAPVHGYRSSLFFLLI